MWLELIWSLEMVPSGNSLYLFILSHELLFVDERTAESGQSIQGNFILNRL